MNNLYINIIKTNKIRSRTTLIKRYICVQLKTFHFYLPSKGVSRLEFNLLTRAFYVIIQYDVT